MRPVPVPARPYRLAALCGALLLVASCGWQSRADDGPLPGVISEMSAAQDAMREFTVRATGAIFIATALHAIAVGNMLPAFHTHRGRIEPLMTICVDQTEFIVNKLRDRGTHQAYGVVTNAQDFMHVLRLYVEKCRQS